MDKEKNVTICYEAKIFSLQLVSVFAAGEPMTKLYLKHILIQ